MRIFGGAVRRAECRQGTPGSLANYSRKAQRVLDDVVTLTIIVKSANARKVKNLAIILQM